MSAFAKVAYFGRTAAQGMRHAPFVHGVAIATLSLALFVVGLAQAGGNFLDAVLSSVGSQVQLTVYLKADVAGEDAEALMEKIRADTGGRAHLIPPAVALGRLAKDLGPVGDALQSLPENPLPASLEVSLPDKGRDPASLKAFARELRMHPLVSDVDYGEAAVERLSALARAARLTTAAAFLIVVLTTVLIVSATLQLAIYARREEIEIQRLVGATDAFVKAPFLLEGMVQGVAAAAVATAALWAFSFAAAPRMAALLSFLWLPDLQLSWVDLTLALQLCAAGAGLGLVGSFLAVRRFSRA